MKKAYTVLRFLGVWLVGASLFFSCETADNVEDPDLHYFTKLYGGDGDQRGVDMLALNDGSLLLLGNSSISDLQSNVYMVRVSADGDVLWEKIFQDAGYAVAKDMERTIDGNFVVVADYIAQDADSFDIKLLKVSPDGELLASNVFIATHAHERSSSITALAGGDFIVSGTTEFTVTIKNPNDPDPDLGDIFNYRFGPDLNEISTWGLNIIGWGSNLDVAVKAVEVSGGFYVFGYTNSPFSTYNPQEQFGLLYFSRGPSGSQENVEFAENIVNETQIESVETLPPSHGGGFIIVGSSTNNAGASEVFIARLRPSLIFKAPADIYIKRTIAFGGRNIRGLRAIPSSFNGSGFLILGNEVRSTLRNFWLSKVDPFGADLWSVSLGSEGEDDSGAAVVELPDGKILVLGTMGSADSQYKMALIKLNAQGQFLK